MAHNLNCIVGENPSVAALIWCRRVFSIANLTLTAQITTGDGEAAFKALSSWNVGAREAEIDPQNESDVEDTMAARE